MSAISSNSPRYVEDAVVREVNAYEVLPKQPPELKKLTYIERTRMGYERVIEQPFSPLSSRCLQGRLSKRNFAGSKFVSIQLKRSVGDGFFGEVWYGKMTYHMFRIGPQLQLPKKKVAVKRFEYGYDREISVVENLILDNPKGLFRLHGILRQTLTDASLLVMKFCNGGTAHEFFVKNVTDKIACYRMLIQMLEKVEFLHQAGYCHRDIHEQNFLLHQSKKTEGWQVFLSDFGHAAKLIGTARKIKPLRRRALYLLNSPREVKTIFKNAENRSNFVAYGKYLNQHGFEIDAYQCGMMLFRLAVSSQNAPLEAALENPYQQYFVALMDDYTNSLLPFDFNSYFEEEHPLVPKQIVQVITLLLTPGTSMPISQAIRILKQIFYTQG